LLSATIVEELELVWVCCGWCTPPITHTNWIELAEDRDRWQALVNAVMKFRVPQNAGNSWLAENLLASEEGLCSMDRTSAV
jgi:hypothetical protein